MAFDLGDYVDVAERIRLFRERYPDGSLQPAHAGEPFKMVEVGGQTFIAFTAAAFRSAEDPRPGIGCAWEPVPGRTPYTKDSELQNAETSAWGRALVAVLAVDTRSGVASRDEVRNRQESGPPIVAATPEAIRLLSERLGAHGSYPDAYRDAGYPTVSSLREMLEGLQAPMEAEACAAALGLVPAPVEQAQAPTPHEAEEPAVASGDPSDPETPSSPPSGHRYDGFKKADLQGACQVRGIAETGTVEELHARLRSADEAEVGPSCHLAECPLAASTKSEAGVLHCPEHEPF